MKKIIVLLVLVISTKTFGQDRAFARKIVDTLASPFFWGRGYTNDGMSKAATFLEKQFIQIGLSPIKGKSYLQPFSYPVNTFPGRMEVFINKKKLIPGKDFIVAPDSRGVHAAGKLEPKDSTHFVNPNYRILVVLEDKLTWSVADAAAPQTIIHVDKKRAGDVPYYVQADIENKDVKNFKAANICGWIKGTTQPDSILVITAHYDHLGGMGKNTFFPGANDNASGVALMLDLARYYKANPPPYTVAFIAFAGEEAGLVGSKYFTENPLFPLPNIRFLVNLDLEGTGEDGITVVNATGFTNEFADLNAINDRQKYFVKINPRSKAANSDQHWFTEKGVPSFFLYTLGGISAYHDVFDLPETLPLTRYDELFKLIKEFNNKRMK